MTHHSLDLVTTAARTPSGMLQTTAPTSQLSGRTLGADAQHFSVRVYADVEALPDHWPRAGQPTDAACHVFQTVEFLKVWADTFGKARRAKLCFVEVRDADGALAMLVPFAIVRKGGARVLSFVDEGASDYNAPILFDVDWAWTPRNASRAWEAIKTALPRFDIAVFDKMPGEVRGIVNPLHLLANGINAESGHLADLCKPWPEIEKRQASYKKLLQRSRTLGREAPARTVVAETLEDREEILAAMLAQKQRRFEETKVPGFDVHPEKREFYVRATEVMAASGALHLSAFKIGDQIVATYWSLTHGRHYYALMIGFEQGWWTKYSPGKILYVQLLKKLFEDGYEAMDSGIGDEQWKLDHCDVTIPLSTKTEPLTWRGHLFVARATTMQRLRQSSLWERLRPLKWIVLRGVRDFRRPDEAKSASGGTSGSAASDVKDRDGDAA